MKGLISESYPINLPAFHEDVGCYDDITYRHISSPHLAPLEARSEITPWSPSNLSMETGDRQVSAHTHIDTYAKNMHAYTRQIQDTT
jgi:hypothetical protein